MPILKSELAYSLLPDHQWVSYRHDTSAAGDRLCYGLEHGAEISIPLPLLAGAAVDQPMSVSVHGMAFGLLLVLESESQRRLVLFNTHSQTLIGEIAWPRHVALIIRERDQHLFVHDAAGRILHLPMHQSAWRAFRTYV